MALWRFRLLLELNIMLHPSTVHLCISRRWTALKWILRAPLSQKVFKQAEHWTRFLPDGDTKTPCALSGFAARALVKADEEEEEEEEEEAAATPPTAEEDEGL